MTSSPITVAIAFKGKIEMTWDLVQQVLAQEDVLIGYMCLYNNGEKLAAYPWDDSPVFTNETKGWNIHAMWNDAIDGSDDTGDCVILNNDLILKTPRYLRNLVDALNDNDSLAMATGIKEDWEGSRPHACAGYTYETHDSGLQSNAIIIRNGLPFRFDDRFKWYYGDIDLACQMHNAGYRTAVCWDSVHEHIGGGSQTLNEVPRAEFADSVAADTELFRKKWPQVVPGTHHIPEELIQWR
jgi:hypothetical protein